MANEFKHVSVGTEITQAEFESTSGHVFNSQATGDIMYASSSSQLTRLGIGSTNAILTVTGGIPAWDTTWTPAGDLLPSADDTYDIGSASAAWQDLFLEGDITLTDAGTIATSAGALTVNGAGGINLQEGGATIIGISDSRAVSTSNTASVDLDATGAIQINSSGGALSVGNDNVDQNVNVATAGTRTLNIGINDGTDLTTITSKGNITNTGTLTVGVDDTGYDVKFFGASAGAYMEWDESADQLRIVGPSADATTSTGKILLATALTDINANDVIGKIDFQAPLEAGGTDAIAIAASIQAVAQATFSSSVNSTDLLFMTGDSEAATEKFRMTSQGELGVGGANYGSSGDVLTSGGAGSAPSWATPTTGDITGVTAGVGLSGGGSSGSVTVTLDLSELSSVTPANGDSLATIDSDGSTEQLTTVANLATLFAGDGLTASSSVMALDLTSNGGLEISSNKLQVATGISQYDVAQFAASVADDDFLRIDGTAVEGRSASEVLSDISAAPAAGDSNIVTTGALDSGSITSGFGAIDNGTSNIRTATITAETAVVPDAASGATLGTTSLEWGHVYIGDDQKIYLGDGQDVSLEYDEDGTDQLRIAGNTVFENQIEATLDIEIDSTPSDETVSGVTATFTAGEDLVRGEVVYFKASDSKMWKAVATASGTSRCVAMAAADISADAAGLFLLQGFLADNGSFPSYTIGGALYTPEAETSSQNVPEQTAPDSDGDFVQVLGWAVTANSVYFNPSNDIIEHA